MDYKEKYEQALERARQFSEHPLQEDSANIVEYIFPELAESEDEFTIPFGAKDSELIEETYYIPEGMEAVIEGDKVVIKKKECEDERIRKALIFYLGDMPEDTELRNGVTNRDVFAWLEKQGQIKESTCDRCKKAQPSHSCSDITSLGRCYIEGEQKLTEWGDDEKIRNLIKDTVISFKNGRIYNVGAEEFGNCLAWLEKQKPVEWSEDDEELSKWLLNNLTELKQMFGEDYGKVGKCIDWFKSLKERMK